jgi:ABC-type transporter MlaC component
MSLLIANKATRMIRWSRVAAVGLLYFFFSILLPAPSRAGGPTEQVRGTVDKVLTIVRSSQPTSKAQMEAQRAQLIEVIYPRFDFTEMAKRSLGRHWAGRTPEEQREFVTIFAAMLGRSYADNIESNTSQNVLYTREMEDQSYAEVDTKIVTEKRPPVSINYNSTASTRSGKSTTWLSKTSAWSTTTAPSLIGSSQDHHSKISCVR